MYVVEVGGNDISRKNANLEISKAPLKPQAQNLSDARVMIQRIAKSVK